MFILFVFVSEAFSSHRFMFDITNNNDSGCSSENEYEWYTNLGLGGSVLGLVDGTRKSDLGL